MASASVYTLGGSGPEGYELCGQSNKRFGLMFGHHFGGGGFSLGGRWCEVGGESLRHVLLSFNQLLDLIGGADVAPRGFR